MDEPARDGAVPKAGAEAVPRAETSAAAQRAIWVEAGAGELEKVADPEELWRIAGSIAAVRAEVDQLHALHDEGLRARLSGFGHKACAELEAILPASVAQELHSLFDWIDDEGVSDSELRIAIVELQGWLDGFISAMGVVVESPRAPVGGPPPRSP